MHRNSLTFYNYFTEFIFPVWKLFSLEEPSLNTYLSKANLKIFFFFFFVLGHQAELFEQHLKDCGKSESPVTGKFKLQA